MAQQTQATRNTITIKGSTKIVTEFFAYAVNRHACAIPSRPVLTS